jgi:hypothetical protein
MQTAQLTGDKEEEREIQREIAELRSLSRKAVGASPNAQKYIAERIYAMGGKTGGKCVRYKVSFRAKGKTVKFMAGGKAPAEKAKDIKGFRAKAKWAHRAARGSDVMASMPSRKRKGIGARTVDIRFIPVEKR